ncbi:MAG TPA: hypothetical protein VI318_04065 [Baekduia sp.]
MSRRLTSLAVAPVALVLALPGGAHAVGEVSPLSATAAMDWGIGTWAHSSAIQSRVTKIRVHCQTWTKVGQALPCTGSFVLVHGNRRATYTLGHGSIRAATRRGCRPRPRSSRATTRTERRARANTVSLQTSASTFG